MPLRKSISKYGFQVDKRTLSDDADDIVNPLDAFTKFSADQHTHFSEQENATRTITVTNDAVRSSNLTTM